MKRTFRAQRMIDRCIKEGKGDMLDEQTVKMIWSLDAKTGNDYNWASVVNGEDLVWIPEEGDFEGAYVAGCDCD